jgi:predicted dehydrogenase
MREIKGGVAGAGVFGGYHANKYASLDGAALTAVYDLDLSRAQALAKPLDAYATDDLDAFLKLVEVVTITAPAVVHGEIAAKALAAGRHVYVEKPLATSTEEGRALVQAARAAGLVLACGHQERVVSGAMGLLDLPERPTRIEAVRRGTPSERNRDVSCAPDLMIHDLDLALTLGGRFAAVQAEGDFDSLTAEVVFATGMTGQFIASRVADKRERTMWIMFPSGEVEIDFLAPSFRNTTPFALDPNFAQTPAGRDPLGTNVAGFLAAVRGEAHRPPVNGEEGLLALELSLAVVRAAGL